jgi:hypothetical protein
MRITRSSSSSSLFTRQQQEQFIPLILLENAMKKFQDAFGVSVFWSIEQSKQKSSVTEERMTPP